MADGIAGNLASMINKLRRDRAAVAAKIAEIDALCSQAGIDLAKAAPEKVTANLTVGSGRKGKAASSKETAKAAPKAKGKRTRGRFEKTAEQELLDLVTSANGPVVRSAIDAHWKNQGRAGKPDPALGKLVKAGKLARVPAEGERGGAYIPGTPAGTAGSPVSPTSAEPLAAAPVSSAVAAG
jgi:hypothetical protein